MQRGGPRWLLIGLVHLALACGHPSTENATPAPEAAASAPSTPPTRPPRFDVAIDPMKDGGECVFGYEGTVLDFGDPSLHTRFGSKLVAAPIEIIEREGSTWARVRTKSLGVDFYVAPGAAGSQPLDGGGVPSLEAHVRGGAA
jgi:hypothetical protein